MVVVVVIIVKLHGHKEGRVGAWVEWVPHPRKLGSILSLIYSLESYTVKRYYNDDYDC